MWRVLILTGPRCGELIALTRDDITPDGLKIDETILYGRRKLPKREKIRMAALPDSLREELTVWLSGHNNHVIFPCPTTDKAYRSTSAEELRKFVNRGRALGIRDLTPRMCRTTFGALFQGDDADRSSIMGHTSTAFTMERYRRPILERRQKSVEELDRLLKVVRIDKKRQA